MSNRATDIAKELSALQALFAEGMKRTSSLQEKLAPVQEHASNKGRRTRRDPVQEAIDKRNKRLNR